MAILKFRIYWEEDESIYRDIVITHQQTFLDLHQAILKAYEFDNKHAATFYKSNDAWQYGREITFEKYGKAYKVEPLIMSDVNIGSQIADPNQKFIYEYDFVKGWRFMVELINLDKEVNKKIGHLSKWYKQRVGLAAALIHDPEVLILDEPTSGLDPNQIIEIREVIKNLGATKTILFSSHIMQEVEAICNRVLIIHKGQIVADDLVNSLQLNNSSNHYVTIQFKEVVSLDMLQNLKEVVSIKDFPKSTFTIETTHPEVMRRQLLELSIERDINIISLNSEKQNLEQIFKTLTN